MAVIHLNPCFVPAPAGAKLKLGIVWSCSGFPPGMGKRRCCALSAIMAQINLAKICVFSLQVGDAARAELSGYPQVIDLAPDLKDFADTAAAIEDLDLVLSVDTSVLHLAGAMAKPVWVLLPFLCDWRWMLQRDDSPWYPTARLFRQDKPGSWDGVLEQVGLNLKQIWSL